MFTLYHPCVPMGRPKAFRFTAFSIDERSELERFIIDERSEK